MALCILYFLHSSDLAGSSYWPSGILIWYNSGLLRMLMKCGQENGQRFPPMLTPHLLLASLASGLRLE